MLVGNGGTPIFFFFFFLLNWRIISRPGVSIKMGADEGGSNRLHTKKTQQLLAREIYTILLCNI